MSPFSLVSAVVLLCSWTVLSVTSVLVNDGNVEQQSTTELFHRFMKDFSRTYDTHEEYLLRKSYFEEHIRHITNMSKISISNEGNTATFGITKFADWSEQEFRDKLLLSKRPSFSTTETRSRRAYGSCVNDAPLFPYNCSYIAAMRVGSTGGVPPDAFDWRGKNVLSGIKNQGECGGCWSFATVETIEAARAIAQLPSLGPLSVQQVLNCETHRSSHGCCGGLISNALEYVYDMSVNGQGLEPESDGGFKCLTSGCPACTFECAIQPAKEYATIQAGCWCNQFKETGLETHALPAALRWSGPLAATIDAFPLKGYTGGIIRHHCPNTQENHAVQLVGYGVEVVDGDSIPYWVIRNSWGADWGEDGYFRIYRGEDACGIASDVAFAVVDSDKRCEGLGGKCADNCGINNGVSGVCPNGQVCCSS